MNILFAGTPSNSAKILDHLAKIKTFNIKGVLTQPDKPNKRGRNLIESPVAVVARNLKLDVFKPRSLSSNEIMKALSLLNIDFLIVIAYGEMIPSWLLKLPNILPINVHFSLLPKYRGASPIQSALLHGDISSGITIIKMSESLDAGDIISSIGVKIDSEDNRLTLEKKLTNLCIKELPKILSLIKSNQAVSRKQDHSSATYCEKILKSDSIIDFKENSKDIINKFRAYFGWPGLSFIYKNINIKIHGIEQTKIVSKAEPGKIYELNKTGLYINTNDKVIVITHLQFPNKKIISSNDAFNAYKDFFK